MTLLVTAIVGGLTLGGILTVISLGMVLAYRGTGTVSFAHGQLMLFGAFIVGWLEAKGGWPLPVEVIIGLSLPGAIAACFYVLFLRRLIGLPELFGLLATLGLASVLDAAAIAFFGANDYAVRIPAVSQGVVNVFGTAASRPSLIIAGGTLVIALALAAILRFTHMGTLVRAAGQDPLLASQGGINIHRVFLGAWAISGALAGLAGIAYADLNIASSGLQDVALAALPAMVIGGMDSIAGALVGGMAVGIFEGFITTYVSSDLVDSASYLLLLAVLLLRPEGLLGTRYVSRL
jgi:branched-chain amino acid transport system permease protein